MSTTIDMEVVQELLDLCDDGDTSLVTELIEMFLQDGPSRVKSIESGSSGGDLEQVERAAHSLKGSSGNLGAMMLMNTAEELQLASRSGQSDRVKELVPELLSNFAAADEALRELLKQYS